MASSINIAFMRLARRAEVTDPQVLAQTFVDAGPLLTLLQSPDHQIIYGRRGTGKTHALRFLAQDAQSRGDAVVYIDMRTVGSNASIYGSPSLSDADRGTRLLVDTLAYLHNALVDHTLAMAEGTDFDYARALRLLDAFADEITRVSVDGDTEYEARSSSTEDRSRGTSTDLRLSASPELSVHQTASETQSRTTDGRTLDRGVRRLHIQFGAVSQLLHDFIDSVPVKRVWLLLDEWSQVPLDLQPVLADLLQRAIFPIRGFTVKIGAIEQLARFRVRLQEGGYVGLEVGADASADVDLDEFMVFGNDPERAKTFFRQLLFRHVRAALIAEGHEADAPRTPEQFVSRGFTQVNAFEELVRAAEGVPRDAINVANLAAQSADQQQISVPVVRAAARTWYVRDKEHAISADPAARDLLHSIQDDVIGQRRARAFFLEQSEGDDPVIASLYNARVLHAIKRGVASYAEPGVRFDVYAIDYGAYIHLQSTDRATLGLFQPEDSAESYVEVPADDYRSIRRAILRLDEYRSRRGDS